MPEQVVNMKPGEVMEIALKSGEILLKSGAEIYRVEETIIRIFESYQMECDCFALLTGIFISVKDEEGRTLTHIRRVKGYAFDLTRIEMVNSFSRSLQTKRISYREALKHLGEIERYPGYRFSTRFFVSGFIAFIYTLIFKGNFYEATAAIFVSLFVFGVKSGIELIGFFPFIVFFISGVTVGAVSLIAGIVYPGINIYKVIMGGIMILTPGMTMMSGIKDALHGDIVSSLYRLAEAILTIVAVGIGIGIVLSAAINWVS
ncbi:MAG: threonine/serine exporter family protein [Clostridia bacterium]|nr:threonine/serine exporter family protein [Clostridia bacterium]